MNVMPMDNVIVVLDTLEVLVRNVRMITRDVTSRIFSSFELFEFWTFRASSEPSLGSILIFELRASFEPKYELQLLSSEMFPCESKVDPSSKSCLELLV